MVVETKLHILDALDRNREGIHLRKLSEMVKGSFPNIRRFVQLLEAEGVVKTQQQGNLMNITLNDSFETSAYLKFLHTFRFMALPKEIRFSVGEMLKKMPVKPLMLIIFGSSLEKHDFKKNPVEMLLVFQNISDVEKTKLIVSEICSKADIKISPIFVDYNAFEKGFMDRDHEASNKIRKDSIVVVGVEHYYNLMWRFLR